jgi:hypothetical protein
VGRLVWLASKAGRFYKAGPWNPVARPFQRKALDKKPRLLEKPFGYLKDVQTSINENILNRVIFPPHICGGVTGRNGRNVAAIHAEPRELIELDIKGFFTHVTNLQVYRALAELGFSPNVARLLTKLTTFRRHLPQGAPTSSALANLVLSWLDLPIRQECQRLGIRYAAWIDNLSFSGPDPTRIIGTVVETLHPAGLPISHRKKRIMRAGDRKMTVGLVLNRRPGIPREQLARFRAGVHRLKTGAVPESMVLTHLQHLKGMASQMHFVDPFKKLVNRNALAEDERGLPEGSP